MRGLPRQWQQPLRKGWQVNSTIEHNGESVTLCNGYPHKQSGFIGVGETITVCAWCDKDKQCTRQLIANGFVTSHGICTEHAKAFFQHES